MSEYPILRQHARDRYEREHERRRLTHERPPRAPVALPRQPMAAMPHGGRVYTDGEFRTFSPPEWSRPKKPRLVVLASGVLSEAERVAALRAQKEHLRAMLDRRRAQRLEQEAAAAEAAPPAPPLLSEAARRELMKALLPRPCPEE